MGSCSVHCSVCVGGRVSWSAEWKGRAGQGGRGSRRSYATFILLHF